MPRVKSTKSSATAPSMPPLTEAFGAPASSNFESDMHEFVNNSAQFEDFGNHHMDFDFAEGMFNDAIDNGGFVGDQNQSYMDANMFDAGMSNADTAKFGQFPFGSQPNMSMSGQYPYGQASMSAQSSIVNERKDQVQEKFGQITPPNDSTPEMDGEKTAAGLVVEQKSQDDIAKLNRAQRARHAANKRHSKSNKRKDSAMDDVEEEGENGAQGKTTSLQREKNRVAAAKCRAKKKATSEEMQDVHREGSKTNSMLHREMRQLRDQKAFLRNALLQHEPGVCNCRTIHCYNFQQAQQLAMGVGAMMPQAMSPSQDSASSVPTPTSEVDGGGKKFPMGDSSTMAPQRPDAHSRSTSFNNTMRYGFPQSSLQNEAHLGDMEPPDFSQMSQSQFNAFLEASPDGHSQFQ